MEPLSAGFIIISVHCPRCLRAILFACGRLFWCHLACKLLSWHCMPVLVFLIRHLQVSRAGSLPLGGTNDDVLGEQNGVFASFLSSSSSSRKNSFRRTQLKWPSRSSNTSSSLMWRRLGEKRVPSTADWSLLHLRQPRRDWPQTRVPPGRQLSLSDPLPSWIVAVFI